MLVRQLESPKEAAYLAARALSMAENTASHFSGLSGKPCKVVCMRVGSIRKCTMPIYFNKGAASHVHIPGRHAWSAQGHH